MGEASFTLCLCTKELSRMRVRGGPRRIAVCKAQRINSPDWNRVTKGIAMLRTATTMPSAAAPSDHHQSQGVQQERRGLKIQEMGNPTQDIPRRRLCSRPERKISPSGRRRRCPGVIVWGKPKWNAYISI